MMLLKMAFAKSASNLLLHVQSIPMYFIDSCYVFNFCSAEYCVSAPDWLKFAHKVYIGAISYGHCDQHSCYNIHWQYQPTNHTYFTMKHTINF